MSISIIRGGRPLTASSRWMMRSPECELQRYAAASDWLTWAPDRCDGSVPQSARTGPIGPPRLPLLHRYEGCVPCEVPSMHACVHLHMYVCLIYYYEVHINK
jgi:hypothetical protein